MASVAFDPTAGLAPSTAAAPAKTAAGALGSMDFMKLLVTQLRYQDPSKPMDDQQFMAQLAQFSSLEQLVEQTRWSKLTYGLGLVGRTVSFTGTDGATGSGIVSAVKLVDGQPMLTVGGQQIAVDQVTEASGE